MQRSWWFIALWLLSLAFALLGARSNSSIAWSVAYLMTGLVIISFFWSWVNLKRVRLARTTRARRSQVGRLAEEQFEITNSSALPKLWLEVRDYSDLPQHDASRVLNSIGGRRKRRWIVRTYCLRRGRFRLGPVTLASSDPLGLFPRRRVLNVTSSLIVYPATLELPGFTPPSGMLPGGDAMRRRTHYITTNVSSVRDYTPGDSFNRIHWRSTARTGRLMVKEFELDPTADVWIVLDLHQAVHADSSWTPPSADATAALLRGQTQALPLPPSTVEYAVTAAASIARHFLLEDRAVGFIAHSAQREVIQPDRGERQLARILETLAVVSAAGRVPFARVLTSEMENLPRHQVLVAISPATDPLWVAALRDIRRRGVHDMAVLLAANTFGDAPDYQPTLADLLASNVPTHLISCGQDISDALSRRVTSLEGGS
ncbi:MAG: DUF58 domain-containing protein [Caldilineales bacterium]